MKSRTEATKEKKYTQKVQSNSKEKKPVFEKYGQRKRKDMNEEIDRETEFRN